MNIYTDGAWFKDETGRTRLLRGVNLSGATKVPYPNGATHIKDGFFDHRNVSFVGRPFPLEEADEHFTRLRSWGLTFLRFLITWEAIEHAGPGEYDTEYLDYVTEVIRLAGEYGFTMFIDPHQDVWSRFSGGDGAPGWTLEAVGFNVENFKATSSAIVHQTHGDPFPRMVWASNYAKLAAATMFTCFYGGDDFAPNLKIDGVGIQDYLQSHYINAVKQVAMRVKDMPHVIGYDTMNEPSHGFIHFRNIATNETTLDIGETPTPFQSMLLGSGYAQEIDVWAITPAGPQRTGSKHIDPQGKTAWLEGHECLWKQHGVWDVDDSGKPVLLRPDYFMQRDGRGLHFAEEYLKPFANRYAKAIREVHPDAYTFFEVDVLDSDSTPKWTDNDFDRVIYAPHWYDGLTLFLKRYIPFLAYDNVTQRPVIGRQNVIKSQAKQLKRFKEHAKNRLPNVPVVVGEIGIPYDLNNREGYRKNKWKNHISAANDYMRALEANLFNFTLWNYTPDNSNERGDLWNGEDLSIFSRDQQNDPSDINSGGRALEAVVRPYPIATAGEPLRLSFDPFTGVFEFIYRADLSIEHPTEIYMPNLQYPSGYKVEVSDGKYSRDKDNQRLIYQHSEKNIPHHIKVMPVIERAKPRELPIARIILITSIMLILLRFFTSRSHDDK